MPDHEVVGALLPAILDRRLDDAQAFAAIRENRGLVPVALDPVGDGRLMWADLGRHSFRDWQFLYTVKRLAEKGQIADAFTTSLAPLDEEALFSDSVRPDGFIFHVSRCGSTLTTKALARPARNMMISQGGPLQRGFWSHITGEWSRPAVPDARTLRRLRTLILAMTRPRLGVERRAFVKFISWNTLYIDLITAAFPGVPCLFLYRDPVEVIASVKKETTAVLEARKTRQAEFLTGLPRAEIDAMSDAGYLAACYARYFEAVLEARTDIACVDYRHLSPANFAEIVDEGLDYRPDGDELLAILEQFRYHAKDDSDQSAFKDDRAEKQAALSREEREEIIRRCAEPLRRLEHSASNVFVEFGTKRVMNASERFTRPHP